MQFWRDNLPGSKDLAVIISGGDPPTRRLAVDRLGRDLKEHPQHLEAPLYSLSAERFLSSGLYYLPKDQLLAIDQDVRALLAALKDKDWGQSKIPMEALTGSLIQSEAGSHLVLRFLQSLEASTRGEASSVDSERYWPQIEPESAKIREILGSLGGTIGDRVYLSLDGGQSLLVLVSPKLGEGPPEQMFAPAVSTVRQILDELRKDYPGLTISLTGEPVLVVDERQTITEDSVVSTVVSLLLVVLVFQFGYREFTRPCLALITLFIGLLWTLGCVALTVGHLNFISVTYVPILVGIGIDFGVHISFRYFECRRDAAPESAMDQTMSTAGRYTLLAAVSNCIPFALLAYIGFRGVAELGQIAMIGILLCWLSSCTVLPALLALLEKRGFQLPPSGRQALDGWYVALRPWGSVLVALTVMTTFLACLGMTRTEFDIHLLKMQNPQLESVRTELSLVANGQSSVLTALIPAPNLEQARELEEKLRALPSVAEVIALSTFLPEVETDKEKLVKELLESRSFLLKLMSAMSGTPPLDASRALELFGSLGTVSPQQHLHDKLSAVSKKLEERLQRRGPGPIIDAANDMISQMEAKSEEASTLLRLQNKSPLTLEDLPIELLKRLRGLDGTLVLRVFPSIDIWRSNNLHQFLDQIRTVSPQVSGEPVLIELFERVVLRTHKWGTVLSLLATAAILFIVLRDIRLVALAGLPTVLSLIQMLGVMGLSGMSFNPANFVAVPMLLGIGSVFGLQSVLRMKELGGPRLLCCSTGLAILLSAATSASGFASLMLADHRGIASLGAVVTLGLILNAMVSLFLLPVIVSHFPELVNRNKQEITPE